LAPLRRSFFFELIVVAYCATIVYATLFPLVGWRIPAGSPLRFLSQPWPRFWTWFDVISNFFAYAPIGIFVAFRLRAATRGILILLAALAAGATLSFTLEFLQSYLPTRVPSRLDLVVNTVGAGFGALLAVLFLPRPDLRRGIQWHRPSSLHPESSVVIALAVVWLLTQLAPQRMLYETGSWLSPLSTILQRRGQGGGFDLSGEYAAGLLTIITALQVSNAYVYFIEAVLVSSAIAALGLMLTDALASRPVRILLISTLLALGVLLRGVSSGMTTGTVEFGVWLSGGAQLGLLIGPIVLIVLSNTRRRTRLAWTLGFLCAGLLLSNLVPDQAFRHPMVNGVARADALRGAWSLLRALALFWPLVAIAVVSRQLFLHFRRWEGLPFIQSNPRSHAGSA
jgi:VanZ family protein